MKRLLGGTLETLHVLAIAMLFGAAALLTHVAAPGWLPRFLAASDPDSTRVFSALAPLVGSPGRVLAAVALVAAVLAPYVRGDAKMGPAWARMALAAGALVVLLSGWGPEGTSGWGGSRGVRNADVESRPTVTEKLKIKADRSLTPWTALALLTGVSLGVGAFQLTSGEAKKAK